eukprot:scaffold24450_cov22-Tisochrysis_lutea.AAC.2
MFSETIPASHGGEGCSGVQPTNDISCKDNVLARIALEHTCTGVCMHASMCSVLDLCGGQTQNRNTLLMKRRGAAGDFLLTGLVRSRTSRSQHLCAFLMDMLQASRVHTFHLHSFGALTDIKITAFLCFSIAYATSRQSSYPFICKPPAQWHLSRPKGERSRGKQSRCWGQQASVMVHPSVMSRAYEDLFCYS